MVLNVKRVYVIKTPREMYDMCQTLKTHSEYRTSYEESYYLGLLKIDIDFEEVNIDSHITENVIDFDGGCKYELSVNSYIYYNEQSKSSEIIGRMENVLDDVTKYIKLKTNLEPCQH